MKLFYNSCFLLFVCITFLGLACEDVDLKGEVTGDVDGFWELNETTGSNTYLLISSEQVVFYYYDALKNCITKEEYEVVRIDDGGFYILTQEGLEEDKVLAISRNGERIHVRDINVTQSELEKFSPSLVEINTLAPICVDAEDVYGDWELKEEGEPTVYLSITRDSILVIDLVPEQECFFKSSLEIIEVNENVFTLTTEDPNSTSGTQEVKITRIQSGIEIERMEDGELVVEVFTISEADFSSFEPVCDFDELEKFIGKWVYSTEDQDTFFYLEIDTDFFSFHYGVGDPIHDPDNVCFEIERFEVVESGEGKVILRELNEPFEETEYLISFVEEDGLLYLDDTLDILTFLPTDIDSDYINNQCD